MCADYNVAAYQIDGCDVRTESPTCVPEANGGGSSINCTGIDNPYKFELTWPLLANSNAYFIVDGQSPTAGGKFNIEVDWSTST